MRIKKYSISNSLLKKYIKYIWVFDSKTEKEISHLLLPVNNIDLILNFSSPIKYVFKDKKDIITRDFHLSGLRKYPIKIIQKGRLNVIGISFLPYGLFDFFNIPVSKFTDKTIELKDISASLTSDLRGKIEEEQDDMQKVLVIEKELLKILKSNSIIKNNYIDLFNKFINSKDDIF